MKTIQRLLLLLSVLASGAIQAQQICYSPVYISLNAFGEANLTTDMFFNGAPGFTPFAVVPNHVDCDDIGLLTVVLYATSPNGDTVDCISTAFVEDKVAPIAFCNASVEVQLDPIGLLTLNPALLDDGSYDACTDVSLATEPLIIQCGDPNPIPVQLIVTDANGNVSFCTSLVSYYLQGVETLACNDNITVYIVGNHPVTITPDMILEGGPYSCNDAYTVELTVEGEPLTEPILGPEHAGLDVFVVITDDSTGNSCWGHITVETDGCPLPVFCDTECHTAPVENCASGHSLEDNVEWPCDVFIPNWLNLSSEYPTPEFLMEQGYASEQNAQPQAFALDCHLMSVAYTDEVFVLSDGYRIVRSWAIFEWITFSVGEYVQEIIINGIPIEVCDVLPWNTATGDCTSGHTLSDAVEWPADDTTNTSLVLPAFLATDPDIHPNNVQPQVVNNTVPSLLTFSDDIDVTSDSTAIVVRTWTLLDVLSEETWTYVQTISVFADLTEAIACAIRENGAAIPDVVMRPGYNTSDNGCVTLDVDPGDVIEPEKSGDVQSGLDIVDLVLLMEHLLGITQLTPYQLYAADINRSGTLSTVDIALLEGMIEGTYNPGDVWTFYDASHQFPDAPYLQPPVPAPATSITVGTLNLAYNFVGVKLGDIDYSYFEPDSLVEITTVELFAEDEVLNNGESYTVSLVSDKVLALQGIRLELNADNAKFDFNTITSNSLPGFNMAEHVTMDEDRIIISYVVPFDIMQTNALRIDPGEPILDFNLTATANGILSKEFALIQEEEQYLKVRALEEHVNVKLTWDDQIASKVRDLYLHGVTVFPNPVQSILFIAADNVVDPLTYDLRDLSGRKLAGGEVDRSGVDISTIANGIYLLTIRNHEGKQKTEKVIIQR